MVISIIHFLYLNTCSNFAVNGGWSEWSRWSSCSKTCGGDGVSFRKRTCTRPAPQNGGRECQGPGTESQSCNITPCTGSCFLSLWFQMLYKSNKPYDWPKLATTQRCFLFLILLTAVNGGWSNWSGYIDCSRSCGGGTQSRNRSCTNPSPQHGGLSCRGNSSESRPCGINLCPGAMQNIQAPLHVLSEIFLLLYYLHLILNSLPVPSRDILVSFPRIMSKKVLLTIHSCLRNLLSWTISQKTEIVYSLNLDSKPIFLTLGFNI